MFSAMNNIVLSVGRITQNGISLLGTCCLLNKKGYLVTASHVPNNDDTNLIIICSKCQTNFYDYQDTTDTCINYLPAKIIATDPFSDICVLKVDTEMFSSVEIGSADDCIPGDRVAIFGFPHSDHGRLVLTEQLTNIGAKVLIGNNDIKTKHLILNVQSRPGQSGGPIFNLNNKKLVGILIGSYAPSSGGSISLGGIDPQTLHQTTHAVSAEYIKDMI